MVGQCTPGRSQKGAGLSHHQQYRNLHHPNACQHPGKKGEAGGKSLPDELAPHHVHQAGAKQVQDHDHHQQRCQFAP
eukprot:1160917-Pelagomonas_calceolata.AAC.5